jgi:outer membrane protein TolC
MTLSWSLLTLALIGAQDQPPSQPIIPRPPISIQIRIGNPTKTVPYRRWMGLHPRDSCALLEEICANLCPDVVPDEATIAAFSRAVDPGADCKSGPPCPKAESCASTLPMPMPKVAKPRRMGEPEARENWPMTLREAIRIALDNSEIVRVIAFKSDGAPVGGFEPTAINTPESAKREEAHTAPIVISRLNADAGEFRFKAELMAEVRSVEQQYWSLAQAHVQLWAADRAASLAKEVLNREQAELMVGRGTVADVAEAAQRLEQFNLDLVTRTSDVITTERQLRNLLGLPPSDNRRIIPVTPAAEARLEPDWDSSLAQMLSYQPDIAQQGTLVRLAELQLLIARNQLLPLLSLNALYQLNSLGQERDSRFSVAGGNLLDRLSSLLADERKATASAGDFRSSPQFLTWQTGLTFQMPIMRSPFPNTRQAQYVLLRLRAHYQQVVHQTTHSLARFFLEIDANYKQFETAKRLRQAAAQRLDAQRAYYEEGRITIDRFLDAISQYATAIATEAQYKATYNTSIVALEEAKGTLLAYDNIVVAERPSAQDTSPVRPASADQASRGASKPDDKVVTASFASEKPKDLDVPPTKAEMRATAAKAATPPPGKTWTFSISIGGANPLQITGTITAADGASAPAAK